MTRFIYGASGAAQVISTGGGPTVSAAHVYTARTGGSVVSDILNLAGGALAGVVTPDARGQVAFQGPDNMIAALWLDFADGGPRWGITPIDTQGTVTTQRAALMLAEYNTPGGTSTLSKIPFTPNSISQKQAVALDSVTVPRVANTAALSALIPSPVDGDRAYNQALHGMEHWNPVLNSGAGRFTAETILYREGFMDGYSTFRYSGMATTFSQLLITWYGRAVGSPTLQKVFNPVYLQFNGDTTAHYSYIGRSQRVKYLSGNPTFEVGEDGTGGSATTGTAATYATINNVLSTGDTSLKIGYVPGSSAQANQYGGGWCLIQTPYITGATRGGITAHSGFGDTTGLTSTAGYMHNTDISGGFMGMDTITDILIGLTGGASWATVGRFCIYGIS